MHYSCHGREGRVGQAWIEGNTAAVVRKHEKKNPKVTPPPPSPPCGAATQRGGAFVRTCTFTYFAQRTATLAQSWCAPKLPSGSTFKSLG